MKAALIIMVMCLLVACGGNTSTETPPPPDAENGAVETGGENNLSEAELDLAYTIQTSGVDLTMSQDDPGGYGAVQINADGYLNFQFSANNSARLVDITFRNFDVLSTGTYPIADWAQREELDSAVVVTVNDATDPENLLTLFSTSGTLTLEVLDGFYVGNFAVTMTGDHGSIHIDEATMVGNFTLID